MNLSPGSSPSPSGAKLPQPTAAGDFLRSLLPAHGPPANEELIKRLEKEMLNFPDCSRLDVLLTRSLIGLITGAPAAEHVENVSALARHLRGVPRILRALAVVSRLDSRLPVLVEQLAAHGLEAARTIDPRPVDGFPEYSLDQQRLLRRLLGEVEWVCTRNDYTRVETRCVERLSTARAATDSQDFLRVLPLSEQFEGSADQAIVLVRDHTPALLRWADSFPPPYPFKGYQIASSFREERPASGRFGSFLQLDVDCLSVRDLTFIEDAEVFALASDALLSMGLQDVEFRLSHKGLLPGVLFAFGLKPAQIGSILPTVKDAPSADQAAFSAKLACHNLPHRLTDLLWHLTHTRGSWKEVSEALLGIRSDTKLFKGGAFRRAPFKRWFRFDHAMENLEKIIELVEPNSSHMFTVDLGLIRGCDIYSGAIMEATWTSHPELGSIAGGGRYDDYAEKLLNRSIHGVGFALGISRIFNAMLADPPSQGRYQLLERADILMTVEEPLAFDSARLWESARVLRSRGFRVRVEASGGGVDRQLAQAARLGIPHVYFADTATFINVNTRAIEPNFDPTRWCPPAAAV